MKTEMSEQPSAHTSQTDLQELNNLGYSLAVTIRLVQIRLVQKIRVSDHEF